MTPAATGESQRVCRARLNPSEARQHSPFKCLLVHGSGASVSPGGQSVAQAEQKGKREHLEEISICGTTRIFKYVRLNRPSRQPYTCCSLLKTQPNAFWARVVPSCLQFPVVGEAGTQRDELREQRRRGRRSPKWVIWFRERLGPLEIMAFRVQAYTLQYLWGHFLSQTLNPQPVLALQPTYR